MNSKTSQMSKLYSTSHLPESQFEPTSTQGEALPKLSRQSKGRGQLALLLVLVQPQSPASSLSVSGRVFGILI